MACRCELWYFATVWDRRLPEAVRLLCKVDSGSSLVPLLNRDGILLRESCDREPTSTSPRGPGPAHVDERWFREHSLGVRRVVGRWQ